MRIVFATEMQEGERKDGIEGIAFVIKQFRESDEAIKLPSICIISF